jgi:hypothetical protein
VKSETLIGFGIFRGCLCRLIHDAGFRTPQAVEGFQKPSLVGKPDDRRLEPPYRSRWFIPFYPLGRDRLLGTYKAGSARGHTDMRSAFRNSAIHKNFPCTPPEPTFVVDISRVPINRHCCERPDQELNGRASRSNPTNQAPRRQRFKPQDVRLPRFDDKAHLLLRSKNYIAVFKCIKYICINF